MKKKFILILPFVIMPVFAPLYRILDSLILVDIFGCGCVPSAQSNMLGIAFNANDLRLAVFAALSFGMTVTAYCVSKSFGSKTARILYCAAAAAFNVLLTVWIVNAFMWA